jgi:hypothetical protein
MTYTDLKAGAADSATMADELLLLFFATDLSVTSWPWSAGCGAVCMCVPVLSCLLSEHVPVRFCGIGIVNHTQF